jgi:hypothetical protein
MILIDITCPHPSTRKSRHYFADSGGRSVGIVRLRTKATEFSLVITCPHISAICSVHFDTISLSKKIATVSLKRCYV